MPAADLIRRVLDDAPASIERLAREANLSPHSLWAWAQERRNPSRESLEQLAEALERRSERVEELAGELRAEARERK